MYFKAYTGNISGNSRASISRRHVSIIASIVSVEAPIQPVKVNVKVMPWHAYAGTKGRQRYSFNPFTT